MKAYGGLSQALGVDNKMIPSGICGNPCSEELKIALQNADSEFLFDEKYDCSLEDRMNAVKTNTVNKCVFCKDDGLCYFAGNCGNRISNDS